MTEFPWGKFIGGINAPPDMAANHNPGAKVDLTAYGFSWEDVAALEHLLRLVGPLHAPDECHSWTHVNGLGLRIAALLPPSDTTGARE